jgi:two-component system, probable response regulator PhcQ
LKRLLSTDACGGLFRMLVPPFARTVLLVDDEPDILESLQDLLGAAIPAANLLADTHPENALRRLRRGCVDLIVSDYRMPGMDGISFLKECRRVCPEAGLLLITGYPTAQLAGAAKAAGITRLLNKPFDVQELQRTIGDMLR